MPIADPAGPAQAAEDAVATPEPGSQAEPLAGGSGNPAAELVRFRDVLELPAYLLVQKPMLGTTLRCSLFGREFLITTSRKAYEQAQLDALPVFTGGELEAIALAASQDRAWPATLFGWVDRKRSQPTWRLSKNDALGEYYPDVAARRMHANWTIGRVFARLGVSLLGVEMEG